MLTLQKFYLLLCTQDWSIKLIISHHVQGIGYLGTKSSPGYHILYYIIYIFSNCIHNRALSITVHYLLFPVLGDNEAANESRGTNTLKLGSNVHRLYSQHTPRGIPWSGYVEWRNINNKPMTQYINDGWASNRKL